MKVEVRLFATLRTHLPPGGDGRRAFLDVPEGTTVSQILAQLGIRAEMAKLVMVDGVQGAHATVLREESVLSVFPPIAGG